MCGLSTARTVSVKKLTLIIFQVRKKPLVIGDIARSLNISITTVSFILNGKAVEKRISAALAERVLKYVKEVGYSANHQAKSLRTGKTKLIGLIVEDIANPFFANIARLIEENAYERGFRIMYCSSENDTEKTRELIKVFRERQVDAYIITPTNGIEKEIESLLQHNSTVVLFDRFFPGVLTNYVVIDNFGGTYQAIKHLVEQGYKNIAFVSLKSEQTQMQQRLTGYKAAVKECGLKTFIEIIPVQHNTQGYVERIVKFLQKTATIDAVFFATNYLGISGLEAINKLHKKIASELGVISFDDHDVFRLYSPSITVVAQPIKELSDQLINILLQSIDSQEADKKVIQRVLPATLIVRESSVKAVSAGRKRLIKSKESFV
jgi:LacI family transcriptional regulator